MSGTDNGYPATHSVLAQAVLLRLFDAMSGMSTEIGVAATRCSPYAVPGTDVAYGATRTPILQPPQTVLGCSDCLRACYALPAYGAVMCGTDMEYGEAINGTDMDYGEAISGTDMDYGEAIS
eukprot:3940805-Rhodomonas_salina.1